MSPLKQTKSGLQTNVGVILVTAKNSDHEVLNRLICHLEALCGFEQDWRIPRTKDTALWIDEPDAFPLTEFANNEWEGTSIAEIERIADSDEDGNLGCFLILDDKGVRDETIILSDGWLEQTDINSPNQIHDWDVASPGFTQYDDATSSFNKDGRCKVRMPWTEIPDSFYATFNMHSCFGEQIEYPCDQCWEELRREEEGDRWYLPYSAGYPQRAGVVEDDGYGLRLRQRLEELRKAGLV